MGSIFRWQFAGFRGFVLVALALGDALLVGSLDTLDQGVQSGYEIEGFFRFVQQVRSEGAVGHLVIPVDHLHPQVAHLLVQRQGRAGLVGSSHKRDELVVIRLQVVYVFFDAQRASHPQKAAGHPAKPVRASLNF